MSHLPSIRRFNDWAGESLTERFIPSESPINVTEANTTFNSQAQVKGTLLNTESSKFHLTANSSDGFNQRDNHKFLKHHQYLDQGQIGQKVSIKEQKLQVLKEHRQKIHELARKEAIYEAKAEINESARAEQSSKSDCDGAILPSSPSVATKL